MSLNGLDGAAVADAHQAALAEAGGWFLLRYASRDTVELLKKGVGGVQEVRAVIDAHEEKSPLYGLVQYRRKKIILKYVPEGTSRLLQVRLQVQFQSVLETFIPHDTVFSFTTASELTEAALGLCTMLLPSAASLTSSSSSLRKRRLNGISEDAEDGPSPEKQEQEEEQEQEQEQGRGKDQSQDQDQEPPRPRNPLKEESIPHKVDYGRRELDELPASAVLAKALLAKRKEEAAAAAAAATDAVGTTITTTSILGSLKNPDIQLNDNPLPPRKDSLPAKPAASPSLSAADKALPAPPEPTPPSTTEDIPTFPIDFGGAPNTILEDPTLEAVDSDIPKTPHTRHLSAAESDSITQWSSNVAAYATVRPKKKKLGPRPHVEPSNRPHTSATSDTSFSVRPVANLPNSVRISNRTAANLPGRPGSQQSTRSVPSRFTPASQFHTSSPPLPSPTHIAPLYRPGEFRPTNSRPASVNTEATTTPEKIRLMKALQLRKRNMLLAQRVSTLPTVPAGAHMHNISEGSESTQDSGIQLSGPENLSNIAEENKTSHSSTTSPTFMTNTSEEHSTKASSFTDHDDLSRKRRSLSSATSSSITPKAASQEQVAVTNPSNQGPAIKQSDQKTQAADEAESEVQTPAAGPVHSAAPVDACASSEASKAVDTGASPLPMRQLIYEQPDVSTQEVKANSQSNSRRLAPPEPLKIASGVEISASDVSEDESLMDELQNATVQEAKPISVARSPVTPIMSKGSSDKLRDMATKTPPIPPVPGKRSNATTPEPKSRAGSVRSVSTALPQWPPALSEPLPGPLTKKTTLGHGISKRIKALEVLSTKDAVTQPVQIQREPSASKSAFSAWVKRSSLIMREQQQHAPNASTDASPPKDLPPTPAPRPSSSPMKESRNPLEGNASVQKGDKISITARIVRDPAKKHPPVAPSQAYSEPLSLYASPLIVEHEKNDGSQGRTNLSRDQSLASLQTSTKSPSRSEKAGRFSFSSHRSQSQTNLNRPESSMSKMSHSGHSKKHGPKSASDAGSISEDKKASMTSRLMKRMSNLASSRGHKSSTTSPKESANPHPAPIQEQTEATRDNSISESLLHVVDIGDVNVQFPDSYLWKRRFMRIDDQGYLIFSPPATDPNQKNISRKYHLSDFNRPALPDMEREEMANSVMLDLKDGRCVQCACESKQAQQLVLQMLVDAHSAYHQLYGSN